MNKMLAYCGGRAGCKFPMAEGYRLSWEIKWKNQNSTNGKWLDKKTLPY